MASWPAKDPDAVLDYSYRIALSPGDSVSNAAPWLAVIDGSVEIDSQALAAEPDTVDGVYGQAVTAWLSGGVDGELAIFRVAWSTTDGRTDDAIVTLPVIESDVEPLLLTGHMKPAPGHLVMRYPAFSSVDAATVQYWLTDAERSIDTNWSEGDYAAALMALAAHNMALAGLGADSAALAAVPRGITQMRSGSLSLSFTSEAANARATGSLSATPYGQEYMTLLRRNRGGPLVTPTGAVPVPDYYPGVWGR